MLMIYFHRKKMSNEKEYKYETDFGTPSANWDEYVKRNNITKWCYIKDIKD